MLQAAQIHTPIGDMLALAAPDGLCLLEFQDRAILNAQIARVRLALKSEIAPGDSPWIDQLRVELAEYFAGQRAVFTLPLRCVGAPFQLSVWEALRQIPYGQTRAYGQIARQLGRPRAARAVGAANGRNPISILIPCHRLVGQDGNLTGYGGGLWRKQYLLAMERR